MCLWHDPERTEQATKARRKAGMASSGRAINARVVLPDDAPAMPATVDDAARFAAWATWAVTVGKIDARTGQAIGYLVNAFRGARQQAELLEEIEAMRRELDEYRRRTQIRTA
jgi:hypothetical protein